MQFAILLTNPSHLQFYFLPTFLFALLFQVIFICTFISCVLFFTQNVLSRISELDFDFIKWLRAQVQGMRKKQIWQPALRKLFSFPAPDDRQEALKFLLQTMKKFQVVFLLRFCPGLHSRFACFYTLSDPLQNTSGMWDQIHLPPPPVSPPPSSSPSENNMKRQTDPYVKASKQKKKTKIYVFKQIAQYFSLKTNLLQGLKGK